MRSSKIGEIANLKDIMWLAFRRKVLVSNKSVYECGLVEKLSHNRPSIEFRCRSTVASGLQLAIGFRI